MFDPEAPIIIREIVGDDITLTANNDIVLRPYWCDEDECWKVSHHEFSIFLSNQEPYDDFERNFKRAVLHDWKMYRDWPEEKMKSWYSKDIQQAMQAVLTETETVHAVEWPTQEEMLNDTILDKGYMCMIDYEEELGHSSDGVRVYPSIDALKKHHVCWEECGIVEVEVKFKKIIVEQNLYNG